jgi:flagellar protein FlbT
VPLKLDFKSGEKLIINGAVVENIGSNSKILIHNESAILREKEILSVADTSTPASRVYFALQCAYMFPHKKDEQIGLFTEFLKEFVTACPSTKPIADEIEKLVAEDNIYKALKQTQKLIAHQAKVLKSLETGIEEATEKAIDTEAVSGEDASEEREEDRAETE